MELKEMPVGMVIKLYMVIDTGNSSERISLHKCRFLENHVFMMAACGLYPKLWSYKSSKITAFDIVNLLEKALSKMDENPEKYKKLGFNTRLGNYEHFRWIVKELLKHCIKHFKSNLLFIFMPKVCIWSQQKYIDRDIKKLLGILKK